MRGRLLLGSLLVLAAFSGAVVTEAERNYAAVTDLEATTASVADASADGDGLGVTLQVDNRMGEPLRVQFVYLSVGRANGTTSASVPYNGYETLPPDRSSLTTGVVARQFETPVEAGETVTIEGYLSVEVYNGYRFEIPFGPREVTL